MSFFVGDDPNSGGYSPPPSSGPGYDPSLIPDLPPDDTPPAEPERKIAPAEDTIGTKVSDGTSAGITAPTEDTVGTPVASAAVDDANPPPTEAELRRRQQADNVGTPVTPDHVGAPVSDGTEPGITPPDHVGTPVLPEQSAAATDQSNVAQASAPIPTEDDQLYSLNDQVKRAKDALDALDPSGKEQESDSFTGEWTEINARAKELQAQSARGTLTQADMDAYDADLANLTNRWNSFQGVAGQVDAAHRQYQQVAGQFNDAYAAYQQRQATATQNATDYAAIAAQGQQEQQNQWVKNAMASGIANQDSLALPPGSGPLAGLPDVGGFTTPSGQAVTRIDDGSGYSHWTIAGADDPSNVLYDDNGNWRAVSRQDAARLQASGATPDQFTSVANAESIAGQAIQSTGQQPTLARGLQAAGMIAAAPLIAATAPAFEAAAGALAPAVSGGALLKTAFLDGLPDHISIPDFVPRIGGMDIQTPELLQHAMGAFLDNPTGLWHTAGDAVHTLMTSPGDLPSTLAEDIHGAFTQTPAQYAVQQGLQDIGVLSLAAGVIGVHNPVSAIQAGGWDGLNHLISVTNPVGNFENQINQGVPIQQAYDSIHNKVMDTLWNFAPWNPLYEVVTFPVFEEALKGLFTTKTGRAIAELEQTGSTVNRAGALVTGNEAGKAILEARAANPVGRLTDLWVGNAASKLADIQVGYLQKPDTWLDNVALKVFYDRGAGLIAKGDTEAARGFAQHIVAQFGGSVGATYSAMQSIVVGVTKDLIDHNAPGLVNRAVSRLAPVGDTLLNRADALEQVLASGESRLSSRQLAEAARAVPGTVDKDVLEGIAARRAMESDIRAAWFAHAGIQLPGTANLLRQGYDGLWNLTRALLLFSAAGPLSIQKAFDEFSRAGIRDVWAIRPADMATMQRAAGLVERSNFLGQGRRAGRFLESGTVRQSLASGILPDNTLLRAPQAPYGIANAFMPTNRYGEAMTLSDRLKALGGAPARALDKWNQSLIAAPTQHVLLNAAYHELPTFAARREAIAQDVMNAIAGRTQDWGAATDAYTALREARGQSAFLREAQTLDGKFTNLGATDAAVGAGGPQVPRSGMASPRVMQDIGRTQPGLLTDVQRSPFDYTRRNPDLPINPATGKAPLPREIAPEKVAAGQEGPVPLNRREQANETMARIKAAGGDITAVTREEYQRARDFLRPQRDPGDTSIGGAFGPRGSRSTTYRDIVGKDWDEAQAAKGGIDLAAGGDGGAGYLSRQQRNIRDDLNAMGGFGTGRTADYYEGAGGANRTRKQELMDALARPYRETMGQHLSTRGHLEDLLAEIRANPDALASRGVAVNTEIGYAEKALRDATSSEEVARVSHDLAELTRFRRELGAIRQEIEPGYVSGAFKESTFGPEARTRRSINEPAIGGGNVGEPVTPRYGAIDRHDAVPDDFGTPITPEPGFSPLRRGSFTATGESAIPLAPPTDAGAIGRAYGGAAADVRGAGQQFADLQRATQIAMRERGASIVGNWSDQTLLGHVLQNGAGVIPPVLPFAPFHIHSTQFWAEYLASHPAMAVGFAQAIGGLDDYGTLHLPGGLDVRGLIKLTTGAHLVDWATKAYEYARAVQQQGGNSPLQQGIKSLAYNTVGNNSFVRPFAQYGTPLAGAAEATTNPLLGPPNATTGRRTIDPREQMREGGTMAGTTGAGQLVNDWLGQPVPRGVVSGLTNPGQALGNAEQRGVSALAGTDLKEYNAESGIFGYAPEFRAQNNWDMARTQAAVADAKDGAPVTADGKALLHGYQLSQDWAGLGRLAPVQIGMASTDKPIYPPFAAPTHSPNDPYGYYVNKQEWLGSPYHADLSYYEAIKQEQNPDFGISDAGRNALKGSGAPDQKGIAREQNTAQANQRFAAEQVQSDITTGRYLNPADRSLLADYDNAKRAYEGAPVKAGSDLTVKDLINQPGNVSDTEQKAFAAQQAGNKDLANRLFDEANRLKGAQGAAVADYFNAIATAAQRDDKKRLDLRRDDILLNPDIQSQLAPLNRVPEAYRNPKTGEEVQPGVFARPDSKPGAPDLGYFGAPTARDQTTAGVREARQYYDQWTQPQRDAFDAFNNLRSGAEYQRRSALEGERAALTFGTPEYNRWEQQHAAELNRLTRIVQGAEQAIIDRTGVNPKELSNQRATISGAREFPDTTVHGAFYEGLSPQERQAYDAFTDLKATADYLRRADLQAQQNAAGPFGSAQEKAWYQANKGELVTLNNSVNAAEQEIQRKYGVNPKELANRAALAGGYSPPYADTTIKGASATSSTGASSGSGPSTTQKSNARSGSSGTGGRSASTSSRQEAIDASKAFRDFWYNDLTGKERGNLRSLDPALGQLAQASSRATAADYQRALERVQAYKDKASATGNATNSGGAGRGVRGDLPAIEWSAYGVRPDLIADYGMKRGAEIQAEGPQAIAAALGGRGGTDTGGGGSYTAPRTVQPNPSQRTYIPPTRKPKGKAA